MVMLKSYLGAAVIKKQGIITWANVRGRFEEVFYPEGEPLSATGRVWDEIVIPDNCVVYVKPRRYPQALTEVMEKETRRLLSQGIVMESVSPYCSPLWVVPKSPDAQGKLRYRVVVDFKELNKYTRPEKYPVSRLEEMDQMNGVSVFSLLDLKAGYHQIRMHEADCEKSLQFGKGKYEFTRMPFGLRNAPTTFQHLMDEFLEGTRMMELADEEGDQVHDHGGYEKGIGVGKGLTVRGPWPLVDSRGECPVAYASKKLTSAKSRYSAIERKLLSVVWAIEHFRPHVWEGESLEPPGPGLLRRRVEEGPDLQAIPEAAARMTPVSRPESEQASAERRELRWERGSLNDKARQLSIKIVPGTDVPTSSHRYCGKGSSQATKERTGCDRCRVCSDTGFVSVKECGEIPRGICVPQD
ncbi:hypothetical protein AAG570_005836 [Ranatra chinensis]|uniref:Reverse transcriptase domain-containing protein n=1 Tax=Ranatra chinensis TaxID=642074 RepID=A0ABD0XYN9_9HEMI